MRIFMYVFMATNLILLTYPARADNSQEYDYREITHDESEVIIKKCLKDDPQACYDYAFYAALKLQNMATYRLALQHGCALHHLEACAQLEKDDSEGEQIRQKCEAGDVDSCVLYSNGRALMYQDKVGAIHYAAKACHLGDQESCNKIKNH